jgi:hypothetical protein
MKKEITQQNKLIAEYMGYVSVKDEMYENFDTAIEGKEVFLLSESRYHLDWNWLMPVVQKISKDDGTKFHPLVPEHVIYEYKSNLTGLSISTPIEMIYQAVVSFVEFYSLNTIKPTT